MKQTEKMPVTREDLFQFHFLSEASLSPDGQWVAYVVSEADKEENCYHSGIWAVNLHTKENKLLATRGEAKSPLWLDNETLLFVSGRDKDEEKKDNTQYYQISLNGGEAQRAMSIPLKVEKLKKLGKKWLVAATVNEKEQNDQNDGSQPQEENEYQAKEGEDYYIYEELPFWFNGKGVRSRKRSALYLFDEESGNITRITPKYLDTVSYDVSGDGSKIAYSGPVYESLMPRTSGLYVYDVASSESKQLVSEELYDIGQVCFLGENRIFYTGGTYERVGKNPRFYVYDLTTEMVKQLPFHDFQIGNTVGSDAKFGGGKAMAYCPEKDVLYLLRTSWGDCQLVAMDKEGDIQPVSKEPGTVCGFDVKGDLIVMTAMRGQHLAEVYTLCPESGTEEKLTGFNDNYLESHFISAPEAFSYQGKNGYEMEGYIIKPVGYEPGEKYPAVLEIHGGPKTASGAVFFHEYQCLANDGYFVLYSNPRGSDGRGEAYADITEVFGKDDFEDLLEFTDEAIKKYPEIEETKIGICGGSYGGFMCNWMVGHTDRYAAAVSQRSISNYLTKCLYTDIGYYANRLQMGAYPWEDFHKVWSMSPLSGAANAKTPLLLLQSDEDYRCWMGDAVQMFSAVKRQGTDTRLVLFHGENHELSRSGKPKNRMTRMKELEEWFEKYL
ncbi:MAG: S9 family peptidase [Lachnospiraceae bacterium]|jgi:dipeptidyl aminopeptidase/acylaminoacyl peptidase|nr:S9 family peptidase [Lachnospiraceae bacterium]